MSATNRGAARRPGDFYATPAWVTRAILPHLPAFATVLDPCAGEGAILREVGGGFGIERDFERVHRCHAQDIPCTHGDALASEAVWGRFSVCVMNPPFSQAEAFVRRALAEAAPQRATVAALLRLAFLEGIARAPLHREHPADVYVLPRRPSFTGGGTDATAYAWFVWGPGRGGRWSILDVTKEEGSR